MNLPLRLGATVVVLPKFDLQQFLTVLDEQKITRAFVAPPIVLALAKHPAVDGVDLSALKYVTSAAAPLDGELAEACAKRLGLHAVLQAYGMTELSPGTHAVPQDARDPPSGAVGKLFPSTEMRLVGADGDDVGRRRGRRNLDPRTAGDEGLPRPAGGDRRNHRPRRAGFTPATSAASTTAATCTSSTG